MPIATKVPDCRLYLITPPVLPHGFADQLTAALGAGDVACLQLRMKGAADAAVVRTARELGEVCRSHNVALIINDRPDLAVQADADGAHIGQGDGDIRAARAVLGANRILGVTCHASRDLGLRAAESGADYVAFGAFFPTTTKDVEHHAELEILEWWSDVIEVPCVAIGGITIANCAPLVAAGADFLAVSSGVWKHSEGPAAAVAAFNAAIAGAIGHPGES